MGEKRLGLQAKQGLPSGTSLSLAPSQPRPRKDGPWEVTLAALGPWPFSLAAGRRRVLEKVAALFS